jgi:hypothetical protein
MKNQTYKKGQMGKTVSIILILAGAIILYIFVAKVAAKSTYEQSINACRLSVIAQSGTEVMPTIGGVKSPFDVNCDRRYVTFYNTKVELGLNPENMKPIPVLYNARKTTKFRSLSDSVVNSVIAEEMRICKYQFADGRIDIFTNDDSTVGTDKVCFVCSEISFSDNVEKKEFTTFLEYTQKTKFDGRTTYYNYLTENTLRNNSMWIQPIIGESGSYGEEYSNLMKSNYNLIDSSQKYYILIQKFNEGNILEGYSVANAWDDPIFIAILPAEKIGDYCEYQAS